MPKFKFTPILLLMALICFVFPFAIVTCGIDNPTANQSQPQDTVKNSSPNPAGQDEAKPADKPAVALNEKTSDKDKPAQDKQDKPAAAKETKRQLYKVYHGYQLVLGIDPVNEMMKAMNPKVSPEQQTAPKTKPKTISSDMPGLESVMHTTALEPIKPVPVENDSKTSTPAAKDQAVTNTDDNTRMDAKASDTDTLGKTEKQPANKGAMPQAPTNKAKPNIYAVLAFILILIGIPLSLMKEHFVSIIVAGTSFIAAIMLYLMKVFFMAYLVKTPDMSPEYMQYFFVNFTPAYWAALILPLLAMIESAIRFAMPAPVQTVFYEEVYNPQSGETEIITEPIGVPGELVDILEPSDLVDDIREAHELERVADLENVKDIEDVHMVIPDPKDENKTE